MRPTLFLDRDGVLNVDRSYAFRIEDLELMPGVAEALGEAVAAVPDLLLIVVTNQGGIALEYYSEAEMQAFNTELAERILLASGRRAEIARTYHCPHHPRSVGDALRSECACRKPGTGMIDAACADFQIDRKRSWLIGDKIADIECARAAELAGAVQIIGAYPKHETPDASFDHSGKAVAWVVEKMKQSTPAV